MYTLKEGMAIYFGQVDYSQRFTVKINDSIHSMTLQKMYRFLTQYISPRRKYKFVNEEMGIVYIQDKEGNLLATIEIER